MISGAARGWAAKGTVAAACLAAALLPAAAAARAPSDADRYSLVHGCFALSSAGELIGKAGDGYGPSAAGAAEPFRMQATGLGRYLLYGRAGDFLAATSGSGIGADTEPSADAEWEVEPASGDTFTLTNLATGKGLTLSGGALGQGTAGEFSFAEAKGCAVYPEAEINAKGRPHTGPTPYGETRGYLDAHMHMMAFEFLGGSAHCGRPWHPYGITAALVDCPDHYPANGGGAVLENTASYGNPAGFHDPVGWPTFKDWPSHDSLTHETSYYKWLERAWRGGQRVFVNLMVDNIALCQIYPLRKYDCNEMQAVRREIRDIYELEDYIDAQEGGPGRGWFRIVTNPYQARRVANRGKLAVVLGIEVSKLFDCGLRGGVPTCDREQVDRQLNEVYRLGVRDLELVNKFDNAFGGVAGDGGTTGVLVNAGNFYDTGQFWDLETCTGETEDRHPTTIPGFARDDLIGQGLLALLPPGSAPLYPDTPLCNTRGLSDLGSYLVKRMIKKNMIIDPDHLSVLARSQVLAQVEAADYSGIVSSHSWGDNEAYERIYEAGGVVTPYAGSSENFVKQWRKLRKMRQPGHYFGFGWGADMNGFGAQGGPREGENPVEYPFKSFDGKTTFTRQVTGERTFDINVDGVAHYGLYPDWVEDLRMQAGDRIVRDLTRGPEAYLQMWERAEGVPAERCRPKRAKLTAAGLGKLRLGDSAKRALIRAGQPLRRVGRVYRYCAAGKRNRDAEVLAIFTRRGKLGTIVSDARGHRAGGVAVGDGSAELAGAERIGGNAYSRRAPGGARYVYRTRGGSVSVVGVSAAGGSSAAIRRALGSLG